MLAVVAGSWVVYASAQRDLLLPVLAGLVAGWVLLRGWPSWVPSPLGLRPGWLAVACLAAGAAWRFGAAPPPPGSEATLALVAIPLQAAAVLASAILALRPAGTREDDAPLWALSWGTVALSSCVPPSAPLAASIGAFVLANVVVLVAPWWRTGRGARAPSAAFGIAWLVAILLLGEAILSGREALLRIAGGALDAVEEALPGRMMQGYVALGGRGPGGEGATPALELERTTETSVYLRSQVFERYRDGAWSAATPAGRTAIEAIPPGAGRQILFLTPMGEVVPAPAGVQAGTVASAKGRAVPGVVEVDEHGLAHVDPPDPRLVRIGASERAGLPAPSDVERHRLLQVPDSLRPLLDTLAREIVEGRRDPLERAHAVETFFTSSFHYSLEPDLPRGDDALRIFLTERRDAYCIYFASASTLMLRTLGLPARMVGGFLAHEVDGADDGRFVVRLRDAHAWTEAFVPTASAPAGEWIRIDATPPDALPDAQRGPGGFWSLWDRASRALRRLAASPWSRARVVSLLAWIAGAAIAIAALLLARRRSGMRPVPEAALAGPRFPWLPRCYERFDRIVRRAAGSDRSPTETDAELLSRLEGTAGLPPAFRELARTFVARYREARFGSGTAATLEELERMLASMEAMGARELPVVE